MLQKISYQDLKEKREFKIGTYYAVGHFAFSLKEGTIPTDIEINSDSNVEMSWLTFAGEYHELYEALIKEWCIENDLGTDNDTIAKYFKLHLERGIGYLSGTKFVRDIKDLLDKSLLKE